MTERFGVELPPTAALDYPTVLALAGFVAQNVAPTAAGGSGSAGALAAAGAGLELDESYWSDYSGEQITSGQMGDAGCCLLGSVPAGMRWYSWLSTGPHAPATPPHPPRRWRRGRHRDCRPELRLPWRRGRRQRGGLLGGRCGRRRPAHRHPLRPLGHRTPLLTRHHWWGWLSMWIITQHMQHPAVATSILQSLCALAPPLSFLCLQWRRCMFALPASSQGWTPLMPPCSGARLTVDRSLRLRLRGFVLAADPCVAPPIMPHCHPCLPACLSACLPRFLFAGWPMPRPPAWTPSPASCWSRPTSLSSTPAPASASPWPLTPECEWGGGRAVFWCGGCILQMMHSAALSWQPRLPACPPLPTAASQQPHKSPPGLARCTSCTSCLPVCLSACLQVCGCDAPGVPAVPEQHGGGGEPQRHHRQRHGLPDRPRVLHLWPDRALPQVGGHVGTLVWQHAVTRACCSPDSTAVPDGRPWGGCRH